MNDYNEAEPWVKLDEGYTPAFLSEDEPVKLSESVDELFPEDSLIQLDDTLIEAEISEGGGEHVSDEPPVKLDSPYVDKSINLYDTYHKEDTFSGNVEIIDTNKDELTIENTGEVLTKEEALVITENIRSTADLLYVLLHKAHSGKAWKPLGYKTFEEYVKTEFNISRSRAYQLLNQANIVAEIAAVTPEGTKINITEATAREIKSIVSNLVPEIQEATEGRDAEESAEIVQDLIQKHKNEKREQVSQEEIAKILEDFDEEIEREQDNSIGGGRPDEYRSEASPVETSQTEKEITKLVESTTPSETRKQFEGVYLLYSALRALNDLPDPEELVKWIPNERKNQITQDLPNAISWINKFSSIWETEKNIQNDDDFDESFAENSFNSQDDLNYYE